MSKKRPSQGEDIEDELNMFKGLPQGRYGLDSPFCFVHL